ncbi:MAG: RNA pseudouridine synthase [Pseudomonadota bacterium]
MDNNSFSGFIPLAEAISSIHIIQAQNGWLAVDKPCGVSVHNDPGHDLVSIVTQMLGSDTQITARPGLEPGFTVHPVHRLDMETSGVMLLATHADSLAQLSEQFKQGQVKKKYMALVHGLVEAQLPDPGYRVWQYPLAKTAGGRNNPKGSGQLVACQTRYKLIDKSRHYSLIQIDLITGRKHQIRRHAKLAGHPVTGDTRYGSKKSIDFLKNKCNYTRLGLHCQSIELVFPGQTEPMCIQSGQSLDDMIRLLETDKPLETNE